MNRRGRMLDASDCAAQSRALPQSPRCVCPAALGVHGGSFLALRGNGGRFLASFRSGGEVHAIGEPGKMRLAQMAFEVQLNSSTGPWLALRHPPSGTALVMMPPGAEGAWTLRLEPTTPAPSPEAFGWCLEHDGEEVRLYSSVAGGFVNLLNKFVLRGHRQRPATGEFRAIDRPADRAPSTRMLLRRVAAAELREDEAYWANRTCHPALNRARCVLPAPSAKLHVISYATKTNAMLCDSAIVAQVSISTTTLHYTTVLRHKDKPAVRLRHCT